MNKKKIILIIGVVLVLGIGGYFLLVHKEQNKEIAKMGGNVSKVARDNLEQKLGKSVISNQNNLNYQYLEEKNKLENKKATINN